ncbi:MAG TPA: alpha/beta hydrolase [Petrimonas sp.]|uniref:alpha/beta hydrolase family protein n=1 Tax=Petrimonas sp. TaxID=2023866 RepID=UPI001756763B|nr:alpha/beta hydrolase [Petrimonas sp.]
MKKNLSVVLLLLTTVTVFSQEITGSWSGTLNIMGNKLPVVFHISKTDSIYTTKMDSPAQNALGLPTSKTSFAENMLEVVATGLGLFYQGTLYGDSIVGTFNQGGIPFPLVLKQSDEPVLNRPQEPKPPFPYKTEEVKFTNKKDKTELAGTLSIPDSAGTFPAVVLIAGSGPHDRDETVFGHKPFLVIADQLTRNGFVVLRYDKRGVGSSDGQFETATTKNFAGDATAALDYLKTRKEVNRSKIGLIGHSEGGVIAPMVASDNRDVRFVVLLAGMGEKGIETIMEQNRLSLETLNMEPENRERSLKAMREIFESLPEWQGTEADRVTLRDRLSQLWEQYPILVKMKLKKDPFVRDQFNAISTPWYRQFLALDPTEYLQKVKCPVLAINGEKDTQVLADKNLSAIKSALDKGRNHQYEIKTYPGLNHLFQECETGRIDEYGKIEETISPEVLSDITAWIKRQVNF